MVIKMTDFVGEALWEIYREAKRGDQLDAETPQSAAMLSFIRSFETDLKNSTPCPLDRSKYGSMKELAADIRLNRLSDG